MGMLLQGLHSHPVTGLWAGPPQAQLKGAYYFDP